jgi:hypothetical protein
MAHIRSDDVVASALRDSAAGMPDAENAAKHGVAVKTIRRWRRLYVRRELPRGQGHTQAGCPRCDEAALDPAAYAELFGWYLGDGWVEHHRRGVQVLHIVNDARYPVLNERLLQLMRTVKPASRPYQRLHPGCVITSVGWKHWTCLLPQDGPGRKHERQLVLAPWQDEILRGHPGPFVRGLFHSDGCRVNNWATRTARGERRVYHYGRWQFVNHSADIRRWCTEALDRLEIPWRQSSWKTVSVSTRAGVARLDELVGEKT